MIKYLRHAIFLNSALLVFFWNGTNLKALAVQQLNLPISCKIGKTCWLVNLVDLDPSSKVRDYNCSNQSYNGHKGTDIRLRNVKEMNKGVPVLAASSGVVKGVRDGEKDKTLNYFPSASIKGKECGNGVVLAHGDGWETQYCHLKNGSVTARIGEEVRRGKRLGLVGMSGLTEFPHLHFSIRNGGEVVDPFIGQNQSRGCGSSKLSLWEPKVLKELIKPLTAIYDIGFSSSIPKKGGVLLGIDKKKYILKKDKALILWVQVNRPLENSFLNFEILGPKNKLIFKHEIKIRKDQANAFYYAGQKKKTSKLLESWKLYGENCSCFSQAWWRCLKTNSDCKRKNRLKLKRD